MVCKKEKIFFCFANKTRTIVRIKTVIKRIVVCVRVALCEFLTCFEQRTINLFFLFVIHCVLKNISR